MEPSRMRIIRLVAIFALSSLAGCVAGTDRFSGPVKGCGTDTRGVLDIRGDEFIFTPDQGVIQLHGTVSKTGQLQGTETAGPANAREHYTISFEGTRDKHTISGKLTRADCSVDLTLRER